MKTYMLLKRNLIILLLSLLTSVIGKAQFVDHFNGKEIEEWFFFTGDGAATMEFLQRDDYATIYVDATKDKHNIYWTIIKRNIASFLDLKKLKDPDFELRVEARVRIHNPPRRLNFMVNTQRTTNFHKDLMEFDLQDTSWHVISMTTNELDAVPGDSLYVQLGVTDFGLDIYEVDIDYYRAEIINVKRAGPDKGPATPYHPPIPELSSFSIHLEAMHDALINSVFPEVNFNDWHAKEKNGIARILTISEPQWAIIRFDLEPYKGSKAAGAGVFEFTTYSVHSGGNYIEAYGKDFGEEFGKVRIIEILGGDPNWDEEQVTYGNFVGDKDYAQVFNPQMIFDTEVTKQPDGKNFITISQTVLQRLLDGTTKGLMMRPLGAINPSFYASEDESGNGPKLHFDVE